MLSVITSYYNRPEALRRFESEIAKYRGRQDIEFIIVQHQDGVFSTGRCHNIGVEQAKGDVILKQDIDCTFDAYDDVYRFVRKHKTLVNIGVVDNHRHVPYGNEYAMLREQWPGEPEWDGYGWEDYALIARWMVNNGQERQLKEAMMCCELENCTQLFRDRIARRMNRECCFKMFHHYHQTVTAGADKNRERFYELILELITW